MTRTEGRSAGFTIIELLIALTLVAILVAVAIPSYQSLRQEQMVKAATQAVYIDMMLLKSEAIKRNKPITFKIFNVGQPDWCYRIAIDTTCDSCADTCSSIEGRKGVNAPEFSGVIVDTSLGYKSASTASIKFSPRRSTFFGGYIKVSNSSNIVSHITLASYGRISTCIEGETCP